jgi:hypothetical protein
MTPKRIRCHSLRERTRPGAFGESAIGCDDPEGM